MHDIRAIRENPDAFDAAMARRGLSGLSSEILAIDEASKTGALEDGDDLMIVVFGAGFTWGAMILEWGK